jgi:hypothetical protein
MARVGASYVKYRQQAIGRGRVLVAFDGGRVCCLDADTVRARRLIEQMPDHVAGVYDAGVSRETIVEDLLIVLGD